MTSEGGAAPAVPPPPFALALRRAIFAALRVYLDLLVILVPTYVAVTLLEHSPALPWMTAHLAPAMGFFGLPGAAALPLLLGVFVSLYAALAAIVGLDLSAGEMTTLALMLGLCHNLIVEGAILYRMRTNPIVWSLARVGFAILAGATVGPWLTGAAKP